MVLPFTGAVGPASADYVTRGLARADREGAQLVVLQIDTPGGLDTSMREIIKAILASRIPVAVFVGPSGARAASAGTYILYASHIAAMAPGTNLGAATPIQIGMPSPTSPSPPPAIEKEREKDKAKAKPGEETNAPQDTLTKKQTHDAAAYIRGLAQLRGRNAEWGERAVREAVSLSADEALAQKVIDLNARDVPELLKKLDGRKVNTAAGERVLATEGATAIMMEPDWKSRFLAVGVALRARRQPVVTGAEELIGSVGVVLEDAEGEAWARVRSEQWRVQSGVPLKRGQDVRVTGRNGLVLTVTPLNEGAGG